MSVLRSMAVPFPPWPWKTNTSGAGFDPSFGATTIAVRRAPSTSKLTVCRPGPYPGSATLADVEGDVDVDALVVDGDASGEHPASTTSSASPATTAFTMLMVGA